MSARPVRLASVGIALLAALWLAAGPTARPSWAAVPAADPDRGPAPASEAAIPPVAAPAADPAADPAPQRVFLPFLGQGALFFGGPAVPFAYGWGVFNWRAYWPANTQYPATSFNWIKVAENPKPEELCGIFRLPYRVLLRLNKADANATAAQVGEDAAAWAESVVALGGAAGPCVDAFEIGNEPNLSMTGAFGGPVNPELYADQLCAAYTAIKARRPDFVVVSAGLAPTAGLPDPTLALTDTVFLRRMLARIQATQAGDAGACFDVLGYHNYGFRAAFDADPAGPACLERSCYRGVEAAFQILHEEYGVAKRVWTTETGWTRDFFAGGCESAPWVGFFNGFQRSDQGQAAELVGALQYGRRHWQWLGGVFVFNLDYDRRNQDACQDEQGWFAVKGYAAEQALEAMPKP
ncbi:MAG: hypothetical protein JNK29_00870 [Anaerolineales bacterium]|nr:hypothetical protein [Anaerolineales bacterium]